MGEDSALYRALPLVGALLSVLAGFGCLEGVVAQAEVFVFVGSWVEEECWEGLYL